MRTYRRRCHGLARALPVQLAGAVVLAVSAGTGLTAQFTDGDQFMSPSSCSSFLRHSRTKKVYWIGNITRTFPRGNSPRYPLIIAELTKRSWRAAPKCKPQGANQ